MLAFVHIEKTAGTSLIHILRRNYFLRYLDVRPYNTSSKGVFLPEDLSVGLRINPFIECIAGHAIHPYVGLERVVGKIDYITVLRDPVKRYVSQYQHWVEKKGLHIAFEEFMEHEELHDLQCRKIAGAADSEQAIDMISDKFITVGVLERFDEFLVLLRRTLGWGKGSIRYAVRNTARNRGLAAGILEKYRDEIVERNQEDKRLYDYVVNEVVPRQIDRYGEGFKEDVQRFRRENGGRFISPKLAVDYGVRKFYYEPVSGMIRRLHGLPMAGSY